MAAIRGSGETNFASLFIDAFVENSRVPSHSNPADGAFRLLCDLPRSLGAEQTTVMWESCRFLVDSMGRGSGGLRMTPHLLKEKDGPIISRELKIWIHIFCLQIYTESCRFRLI